MKPDFYGRIYFLDHRRRPRVRLEGRSGGMHHHQSRALNSGLMSANGQAVRRRIDKFRAFHERRRLRQTRWDTKKERTSRFILIARACAAVKNRRMRGDVKTGYS